MGQYYSTEREYLWRENKLHLVIASFSLLISIHWILDIYAHLCIAPKDHRLLGWWATNPISTKEMERKVAVIWHCTQYDTIGWGVTLVLFPRESNLQTAPKLLKGGWRKKSPVTDESNEFVLKKSETNSFTPLLTPELIDFYFCKNFCSFIVIQWVNKLTFDECECIYLWEFDPSGCKPIN